MLKTPRWACQTTDVRSEWYIVSSVALHVGYTMASSVVASPVLSYPLP